MKPVVLVLNVGSSSVKAAVYPADQPGDRPPAEEAVARRDDDCSGLPANEAVAATLSTLLETHAGPPPAAVGHRIVHGGPRLAEPVVVTPAVLELLEAIVPLAPLHLPQGIAGIRTAMKLLPEAVQVACFDTAFHRSCPEVATRFALPRWCHDAGIRRYGFHGLSYEAVAGRLPELAGEVPRRTVIAHLGAGASVCGLLDGRSVATSMGFTPLDGLVMATRCGSLDPGVVLHLLTERGMTAEAVGRMLRGESGLAGVSGISGDMRVLLASDDPAAREAVELFCYRAVREIASLAAALGGLDAVVFTAGIGEHSPEIREAIGGGLRWLGLEIDPACNAAGGPRISRGGSRVSAWVIPTDESGVIARHARRLLATA